jgi:hypothetical protein
VPQQVRTAVEEARQGRTVKQVMTIKLPDGMRTFLFSVRPVLNGRGEIVGLVPEALELPAAGEQKAA